MLLTSESPPLAPEGSQCHLKPQLWFGFLADLLLSKEWVMLGEPGVGSLALQGIASSCPDAGVAGTQGWKFQEGEDPPEAGPA